LHQPPQWTLFQRLLHHPEQPLKTVTVADAFGIDEASYEETKEETSPVSIHSRPTYTAVLGQPYVYQVQVSTANTQVQFDLDARPEGMEINPATGRIEWVPATDMRPQRAIRVEVIAFEPTQGVGQKQTFMLSLSRYVHPLGTDGVGRDMLAALVLGTRWTLLPGLIVAFLSTVLGVLLGGLSGYYRGSIDMILTFIVDVVESFPALVLIFLAAAILNFSIYPIMVVVGIVWFPRVARAIRDKVLSLKAQQFVEAAKELGLRDAEILWKDIIWYNARYLVLAQIFYAFAFAVLVEVTLSYVNLLGRQADEVSWGYLLVEGKSKLFEGAYGLTFFPALAIVITITGLYLIGDNLSRIYTVKED
jgi:peptide/nickel transport system permease protein